LILARQSSRQFSLKKAFSDDAGSADPAEEEESSEAEEASVAEDAGDATEELDSSPELTGSLLITVSVSIFEELEFPVGILNEISSPVSIWALVPDESSEQAESPKARANAQGAVASCANHFLDIIKLLS
jgi:hypothetical protein